MARKLAARFRGNSRAQQSGLPRRWCEEHAEDATTLFQAMNPEIWAESIQFADGLAARARAMPANTSGEGDYRVLYFLVRLLRPATVVETGVAAGYSSAAILRGMAINGCGHLWSSDFPYFRNEDPEKNIGVLVDESVREHWTLHLRGDRKNLPRILDECGAVDMFHYDSDKSVLGRRYALEMALRRLAPNGIVIIDDIQDNFHFRDWIMATSWPFHVVSFAGKYLGIAVPGGSLADLPLPYRSQ